MNTILIQNGRVVDPDTKKDGVFDIFIEDGVIAEVGKKLEKEADRVIDAEGLTVLPGLVDLHVHLRDPGQEYKEDVVTGSEAAAHGGVTSLLAMPNTHPPMDSVNRIGYVVNKAKTQADVHVYQSSTITKGMKGEELVDFDAIAEYGVLGFTEDGKSVMNTDLLYQAMKKAKEHDLPIMEHCEDITMVRGGVMNEDENAERLGFPGISNTVEDVIVARDCVLAAETGTKLHLQHCSTAGSVRIIADVKKDGAPVTAEACPHHFILSSDDIPGDDANYKMNPPLRSKEDVAAIRRGIIDGTIDCISTDHAPHSEDEKKRGFRNSPFGIVGIETSAALTYTELVRTGDLTLMQMAEKMSYNPAKILGIPAGSLREGMPADIAVFDFEHPYTIDTKTFLSRGKNTPFAGREVYGAVKFTIVDGKVVWEARN
ncbi:MAG: dihydroorotase [Lachnospiraceae bacterium]|nr:dihydroorotase [Lachnospiraceae bacterium]